MVSADVTIGGGLVARWHQILPRQFALEVRRAGPARQLIGYAETDASAFEWLVGADVTDTERETFAVAETMLRRAA